MIDHLKLHVRELEPAAPSTSRRSPRSATARCSSRRRASSASAWSGRTSGSSLPRRRRGRHVAFAAETTDLVDAFHAAALDAGGRDNGAPGMRPQYHPGYYGGFVLDLDGNNVEAVCHRARG